MADMETLTPKYRLTCMADMGINCLAEEVEALALHNGCLDGVTVCQLPQQ